MPILFRTFFLYFLSIFFFFVIVVDPHLVLYVDLIERWRFADGVDALGNTLHEPGADNHLAWHFGNAASGERLFAVVLTMPELRESDSDSQLIAALEREMELALYLPVWVGPKDQGVYVYLPKRGD